MRKNGTCKTECCRKCKLSMIKSSHVARSRLMNTELKKSEPRRSNTCIHERLFSKAFLQSYWYREQELDHDSRSYCYDCLLIMLMLEQPWILQCSVGFCLRSATENARVGSKTTSAVHTSHKCQLCASNDRIGLELRHLLCFSDSRQTSEVTRPTFSWPDANIKHPQATQQCLLGCLEGGLWTTVGNRHRKPGVCSISRQSTHASESAQQDLRRPVECRLPQSLKQY